MTTHPHSGATVAFATRLGKEQLTRAPFATILQADVIAPADLGTDQFGTFTGEIDRALTPLASARVKARLGGPLQLGPRSG